MKNKEKYAKEIVDIVIEECHFALNEDGKIVSCGDIKCSDCLFNVKGGCNSARIEWANTEYENNEPNGFTKREKTKDENYYYHKYSRGILMAACLTEGLAVDKNIRVVLCSEIQCSDCLFDNDNKYCKEMKEKWASTLDNEYKEQKRVVTFGIKEDPAAKGRSEND